MITEALRAMSALLRFAVGHGGVLGDLQDPNLYSNVKRDVEYLLTQGWTVPEVVSKLMWIEEVNPSTDEDVALRNMAAVELRVSARLARDPDHMTRGTIYVYRTVQGQAQSLQIPQADFREWNGCFSAV